MKKLLAGLALAVALIGGVLWAASQPQEHTLSKTSHPILPIVTLPPSPS